VPIISTPAATPTVEVSMKCRCPACGRITFVPREQLDFVVRCECCRTLLLTRTHGETSVAVSDESPVEVVQLLDVAYALRKAPPSASLDIADYMTRRQARGHRAIVSANPPTRRASGLAVWSVLAAIACLAIAALIVTAVRLKPATAKAVEPAHPAAIAHAPAFPPVKKSVVPPKPIAEPVQSEDPAPTGDGELFPDVPAKK
jgi:ribosomal protein S27E